MNPLCKPPAALSLINKNIKTCVTCVYQDVKNSTYQSIWHKEGKKEFDILFPLSLDYYRYCVLGIHRVPHRTSVLARGQNKNQQQ